MKISEKQIKSINRIRQEVSFKPEFLQSRILAENSARVLLDNKAGRFKVYDLELFLNHCNTERIPLKSEPTKIRENETLKRFGVAFIGQNRRLMVNALRECNYWIGSLWKTNDDPFNILSQFWKLNEVAGAGMGLPTMILYLKNPAVYNVWLPFLNTALSHFTGQILSSKRNAENYYTYNSILNKELREPFDLKPQEIDYIIFRISF